MWRVFSEYAGGLKGKSFETFADLLQALEGSGVDVSKMVEEDGTLLARYYKDGEWGEDGPEYVEGVHREFDEEKWWLKPGETWVMIAYREE